MMVEITRRGAVFGISASTATLVLPSMSRSSEITNRPNLRVAVQEIPTQLDPLLLEFNSGQRVMFNVYDTLIDMDYLNNMSLRPGLAVSWERAGDLALIVRLRDDVSFHDGSLMTAEDVAFSFGPERMMNPKSRGFAPSRAYFGTVAAVEALDARTVRITTSQPDPVLPLRFAGWTGQILSKAAFLRAHDWDKWAIAPVATGPYKLEEFVAGERIVLRAFDGYWGGRPPYERVSFLVVPELSSRISGLMAGDYDIITELPTDQFRTIEKNDRLEVVGGAIANPRVLKYDKTLPVLSNVNIRRALNLAIDRKAIVDGLWAGKVSIPNGHQLPYYGDLYLPSYPAPKFAPEEARKLIAASGYGGEPIPYRTMVGYYAAEIQTAQALKAMWESVGLKVDLQVRDNWGQILGEKPSFGIRNGSDPILYPDPTSSLWRAYGPGSRNAGSPAFWQNDRFDELGKELTTTLDVEKRRAAFREMLDIYSWDDPPGTVLHSLGMFYAKRKAVAWKPYPAAYMDFRSSNISGI